MSTRKNTEQTTHALQQKADELLEPLTPVSPYAWWKGEIIVSYVSSFQREDIDYSELSSFIKKNILLTAANVKPAHKTANLDGNTILSYRPII